MPKLPKIAQKCPKQRPADVQGSLIPSAVLAFTNPLIGVSRHPACNFFWLKYLKTGLAINLVCRVNRYDSLLFLRWHYASHPTWSKLAKLVKRWIFAQMYLLSLVTKVIVWVPILAQRASQIQQVTKMALTCGMIRFTRWGRPIIAYQDCELLASRNTPFVNKRALKRF